MPNTPSKDQGHQTWFERAQSHRLTPKDNTAGLSRPDPALVATLARNFAKTGAVAIHLDLLSMSEGAGRTTLLMAAGHAGVLAGEIQITKDSTLNMMKMVRIKR